ncbi:MAG TPA: AraC family transcriptional regulator [Chitinophagaceae bacterium]|nr:AraC family transcriptional regulator [Chitinophagaceae bacterium]
MKNSEQDLLQFIHQTGYRIEERMMENIEVHYQRSFNFSPQFTMFFVSYTVKHAFSRHTMAPTSIKNCICFFFKNIFDDESTNRKTVSGTSHEKPVVRIFPSTHTHTSYFKKGSHRKMVAIFISAAYLKSFLEKDAGQFQFLFQRDNTFLIEEIMTDDILQTVNDIVKEKHPRELMSYYYKLKTMELLFHLFQSLSHRRQFVHYKLNKKDIISIYNVRDQLISSLQKPTPISDLKQIAGMNELKMRKLFTQIFGMGIYDYFQHLRMKEAAKLMREKQLTVSEAGYQMGFENLSHFSRVFKKHIGKLPKQYSMEFN